MNQTRLLDEVTERVREQRGIEVASDDYGAGSARRNYTGQEVEFTVVRARPVKRADQVGSNDVDVGASNLDIGMNAARAGIVLGQDKPLLRDWKTGIERDRAVQTAGAVLLVWITTGQPGL